MRRRKPFIPFESPLYRVVEYGQLTVGAFLVALSFNLLYNPNQIAAGGVAGISTIAEAFVSWEPALTQWALNIPLFIIGLWLLGRKFGVKTAYGSIVLPLFVFLTRDMAPLTNQMLLAAIFGGIGVGVGLGLVFRGRGSTGGVDLVAQIVHHYTGLSHGLSVAMLDGLVILTAGIVFSPEQAMYALIGLFVTSKTIDIVQIGFSNSKVAFIITERPQEVREVVLRAIDRGLTVLRGFGGYTGEAKQVFMIVVGQTEVTKMKALVRESDPEAFIILSDTAEVLGEGFRLTPQ